MTRILKNLPRFLSDYVIGLIAVVFSDYLMTSLLVGCILLAFVASPLIAFTTFFLLHSVLGTLANMAMTHMEAVKLHAGATMRAHRQVSPPKGNE